MKELKGMITVEMAYIVPFIFSVFFLSVMGVFYYHDKAVVAACAYEAATIGSVKEREKDGISEDMITAIFKERIAGKTILFGNVNAEVSVEEERVTVTAEASRKKMKFSVQESARITNPEDRIRNYRKLGQGKK